MAENFDDVLESVLSSLEDTISKDDSTEKLKRVEKVIVGEIAEDMCFNYGDHACGDGGIDVTRF